jgi:hypothetical protein
VLANRYNLMGEFAPRESKEFQGKKLGSVWIPLLDSRLFNGLQRIQIENSPALSTTATVAKTGEAACRKQGPFTR